MDVDSQKIVLTGGPGFGKSTVLQILAKKGFVCMPEAPREIILEQQAKKDGILPQDNFIGFANLVLERMIRQFQDSGAGVVLYDRALPDLPAYLSYAREETPTRYRDATNLHRYNSPVFFFPPWKAIYNVDGVRYETFEQAVCIGELIRISYSKLGYQVIDVPIGSAEGRAEFVMEQMLAYSGASNLWFKSITE